MRARLLNLFNHEPLTACVRCMQRQTLSTLACVTAIGLASCSDSTSSPATPPPPQVIAMEVIQRDATVTDQQVGEVTAFREVALRPQVTGTVQKILFEPGQRVREGEVLFIIDPRPYEASLAEARAALADSQAELARARQDVARYEPLLPHNAIPRATYDAAVAAEKSAQAAVEQRRAGVNRLRLDLQNAKVTSPVTGQIGLQQVEVGGLATAGQTVLATVSTLDPVYVTFNVSEASYIRFMRGTGSRQAAAERARSNPFRLILPDGSAYEHPGIFDFADRAISATTGTLGLRAKFPNPETLLRPGMNVRVQLVYEQIPDALLVPQRAVTELLNRQFVSVLGPENKVEQRAVELGDRVDELWIVQSGLQPGERIVVDGVQKAPSGSTVAPTMISEAQLDAPPVPVAPVGPETAER